MSSVLDKFAEYRAKVATDEAAAVLVLAEVLSGEKQEQPLTVKEAAALAGVTPETVYEWCRTGQIKHHRMGRGIRIYQTDLASRPSPLRLRHLT